MRCWTRVVTVASAAIFAAAATSPVQAGDVTSIRGRVIFKGDPAKYKRTVIDRSKNPACEKEVEKVETEDVILNEDTDPITIRNVLVSTMATSSPTSASSSLPRATSKRSSTRARISTRARKLNWWPNLRSRSSRRSIPG